MRKTLNINLGGMAFIIDENAFELLHTYLETLKQKFNNETERAEIMNDIEARIAEMLGQRLQNRKEVIGIDDVQFVTDAMGRPEDIAGDETEETSTSSSSTQSTTTNATAAAPVKRRLFRDPDDTKIGGVISGLCHYFGIEDPTWMRIAALILILFSFSTVILVYILLLVIVPKAQTAAEKLQMKGEPVNINTIEKEIKDAANRAGQSVQQFMGDQNIFERLWDATLSIGRVFLKLFAVVDIFFSMIFLIVVAGCFFVFYVLGSTEYNQASQMLVDSPSVIRLFSVGFLLFIATPLIALIYLGLKILLGQRSRVRWLKTVLFIGWFVGLVFLVISIYHVTNNFRATATKKDDSILMQPARGTLYAQLTDTTGKKLSKDWDEYEDGDFNINDLGGLTINGYDFKDITRIPLGSPSLEIMPSENDSFYVQKVVTSQGRNKGDANNNADMVIYTFSQTDTVLNLSNNLYLNKSSKWRAQKMRIRIAIPEGKNISFADNIDLWHATVKGNSNYDDTYFANTTWTVTGGKVKCIAGENHKHAEEKAEAPEQPEVPEIPQVPTPPKIHQPGATTTPADKETDKDDKDSDKDF